MATYYLRAALSCAAIAATAIIANAATEPFPLPMDLPPTAAEFEKFVRLDANSDENQWIFDENNGCISYKGNKNKANDWVFIPFAVSSSDTNLKASVEALATGANGWIFEKFELAVGDEATPEAMTVILTKEVQTASYAAVETSFTNSTGGTKWLGIHATCQKQGKILRIRNIKVENNSVPVPMPAVIKSSEMNGLQYSATVTMPSASMQGSAITSASASALRMSVDGVKLKEYIDLTAGSDVAVSAELSEGKHTIEYVVLLTTGGTTKESTPVSEEVTAVDFSLSFNLPYQLVPIREQFGQCLPVDANGDGVSWEFNSDKFGYKALYYSYSRQNPGDDWLILPAIDFAGNKNVRLYVDALTRGEFDESFEICLGNAPSVSAMTVKALDVEVINNDKTWTTYAADLNTEGGKYYVGIHVKSPKDLYGLFIRNIRLETEAEPCASEPKYTLPLDFQMNSYAKLGECMTPVGGGGWTYVASAGETKNMFAQKGEGDEWLFLPATDFGNANRIQVKVAARPADASLKEGFEVFVGSNSTVGAMTEKVMEKVWDAGTFTDEGSEAGFEICTGEVDVDGGVKFIGIHVLPNDHSGQSAGVYFNSVKVEDISPILPPDPIIPPYQNTFDSQESVDGFTILNSNNDDCSWYFESGYGENKGYIRLMSDAANSGDDWFITPPVSLKGGEDYEFSITAWSKNFPERLEVCLGSQPTADAMTTKIIQPTEISKNLTEQEPGIFTGTVSPDKDGIYYIGIHGISDPDMFYLNIDDLKLSGALSCQTPAAPTNLKAESAADGQKSVTISFDVPRKDINGDDLVSVSKVEILRNNSETPIKIFENVTPGESLTYTDTPDRPGEYTYTVVAYNKMGKGELATVSVFCGVNLPAEMRVVDIVENATPGQVTLSWLPVSKDINDKDLPAGSVKYNIYGYAPETGEPTVEIASGIEETAYTFQAYSGDSQIFVRYFVCAVTEMGEGEGKRSEIIPIGHPYKDFHASFADGNTRYEWTTGRSSDYVKIGFSKDTETITSQDGDNGFAVIQGESRDMSGALYSGKISLEGIARPSMTFYTYNMGSDATADENLIVVEIKNPAGDFVKAYEKSVNELSFGAKGWVKVVVDISEYAGDVIEFSLGGTVKTNSQILFDNISFPAMNDNDMSLLGIVAPSSVDAGAKYEVKVTVRNNGLKTADGWSVTLKADGDVVGIAPGFALAPNTVDEVSFSTTMSPIADKPVELTAELMFEGDADMSDNAVTEPVVVTPVLSSLPYVKDLTGKAEDGFNRLTWSEPDLEDLSDPANEGMTLLGYNVYRDGEKLNDAVIGESSYDDYKGENGVTYAYRVTAVYSGGESRGSNEVELTYLSSGINGLVYGNDIKVSVSDGDIKLSGASGRRMIVSTLDGRVVCDRIASGSETVKVTEGVYIVKAGDYAVKLIVK